VERVWGVLENYWRGGIIDSVDKALGLARSMTYRGLKPTVRRVTKVYRKGISVAKNAMRDIEARLERTAFFYLGESRKSPSVIESLVK
jgi:hypothetical protein